MMRMPRPGLYRAARVLRILAVLSTVVVLLLAALIGLSAAQIRPSWGNQPIGPLEPGPNETAMAEGNLSVANPGLFAIDRLSVTTIVRFPGPDGAILATGGSPVTELPGGRTTAVPFTFSLPLSASADRPLLTENLLLPTMTWVNATYATIFAIALTFPENLSWGAPFDGLNVTPGTPHPETNGTDAVPFTITFTNDADFGLVGALAYRVDAPAGAACVTGELPLDVGPGSPYDDTQTLYVPTGCVTPGSSVALSYDGGPWSVNFPPEELP